MINIDRAYTPSMDRPRQLRVLLYLTNTLKKHPVRNITPQRRASSLILRHTTHQVYTTTYTYTYLAGVEARAAGEEVEHANGRGHRRRHFRVAHEVVQHLTIPRQESRDLTSVDLQNNHPTPESKISAREAVSGKAVSFQT